MTDNIKVIETGDVDINKLENSFEGDEGLDNKVITSFEELDLKDDLLRGISNIGFSQPSPIQGRAIAPAIRGYDLIAQAQSGSGKTATFVISVLQRIQTDIDKVQAIVVSPTRELAKQTQQVFQLIGEYMNLKCHAFIGGTRVDDDSKFLKVGCHVAVGTPGRINHIVKNGYLRTESVTMFVLDEADEMLSCGFKEQMYNIFKALPDEIQIMMYSATLSDESLQVSSKFMRKPIKILMKKEKLTLEGINQYYIQVDDNNAKVECIADLYGTLDFSQAVIFTSSQRMTEKLAQILTDEGHSVSYIHARIDQKTREETMAIFRTNQTKVLISTDLTARGIDIQNVSLVINFDLPSECETYLHRIGRSGRFGRKGVAISFVGPEDVETLSSIMEYYNTQITPFIDELIAQKEEQGNQ